MTKNRHQIRGFTLVELMIVVAIIGIMAAIAIPVFLRYVRASKVAEVEGILKKATDGAKSYYTADQRYSEPVGDGGDQPWHGGNPVRGNPDSYGMPVTQSLHTFPGGEGAALCSVGGFGATCSVSEAPDGGAKSVPDVRGLFPHPSLGSATLKKLLVDFEDPMYFAYGYETSGTGLDARATLIAMADFDSSDSARAHTVIQYAGIDPGSGEVAISPASTTDEFQ